MGRLLSAVVAGAMALAAGGAWAQYAPRGIYVCTDAHGRRLTADRPIPECSDREQKLLSSSGTVREVLPPTPTARERELKAEQERRAAENKQRQAEARRAERGLVARYPNQAMHDAERAKALTAVRDVTLTIQRHIEELGQQKKKLQDETAFYKDPSQYPPKLKRQLEEHEQKVAAQHRALAIQEDEKTRVNARFDEELARLKALWAPPVAVVPAAAAKR